LQFSLSANSRIYLAYNEEENSPVDEWKEYHWDMALLQVSMKELPNLFLGNPLQATTEISMKIV